MKKVYVLIVVKDVTGNIFRDIRIVMVSMNKEKISKRRQELLQKERLIIDEIDENEIVVIPWYDPADVVIMESVMFWVLKSEKGDDHYDDVEYGFVRYFSNIWGD